MRAVYINKKKGEIMTTQTKKEKNQTGIKSGLKTILVLGGTLLIPFYAIYLNTDQETKLKKIKSTKPIVETTKKKIEKSDLPIVAINKINKKQSEITENVDYNKKSFAEAYKYNRDTYGEGWTFTWRNKKYVVNTYKKIIPPSKYDALDYNIAFADARNELGPCSEFNWRGNVYKACLIGESIETITSIPIKTNIETNQKQILANK